MKHPKIGDKMFLTATYEECVEITVTNISENRINFTGSRFYTFANKSDTSKVLFRTKDDLKEYLINKILFKINNHRDQIKRINSL